MDETVKSLIVEPSPLPILIPVGPKYSPQDTATLCCIKMADCTTNFQLEGL